MFIEVINEYGKEALVNLDNVAEVSRGYSDNSKICMVKNYPDIYVRHSFEEMQRIIKRACVASQKSAIKAKSQKGGN